MITDNEKEFRCELLGRLRRQRRGQDEKRTTDEEGVDRLQSPNAAVSADP